MNLKGIGQYLESVHAGRVGEDIFVTEMPLECKEGVLLLNRYAGSVIDHELPGWRDTGFRIVIRSVDYERGEALAVSVSTALTVKQDTPMGALSSLMLMKLMLPMNDPLPYRRSDAGVWEFEVDIECIYIIGG
jgi:hypothetical protein